VYMRLCMCLCKSKREPSKTSVFRTVLCSVTFPSLSTLIESRPSTKSVPTPTHIPTKSHTQLTYAYTHACTYAHADEDQGVYIGA